MRQALLARTAGDINLQHPRKGHRTVLVDFKFALQYFDF